MRNIFSPQIIRQIKNRLDLVKFVSRYVQLDRNLKAICAFHPEKTPSFSIHPNKKYWRCFGCGIHGDIFTFVQRIEKITFSDAVTLLAQEAGIAFPKSERFKEYLSRRWQTKKELLTRFKMFRFYLKQAQLDREDQLRLERKSLPPRIQWDSWDAQDFLKHQMVDYKFDCLRDRVRKIEKGFHEKEKEVRGNG